MITRIGLTAGNIWSYLDENKKSAPLDSMISNLNIDRDLVLMSIGWLAREGHVVLDGEAPGYVVRLSSHEKQH